MSGSIDLNSARQYIRGIREDRLYKIAIITLYAVINLWLYVLSNTPPAKGYEISIYNAYPPFFWFLFIFTIILGISLTIDFIVRRVSLWRYSLPAIFIADTVVLFLPLIRSYKFDALGGSDIFAHLAWSKHIVNTGYIQSGVYYPATHILVAMLDQLSFLNPSFLTALVSFTFFVIYLLCLFILGKVILNENRAGALFFVFGSPLILPFKLHAFWPFIFALLLFPLVFYIMRKIERPKNRKAFYICFVIVSLFIVFLHPMISLVLLLILGVLYGYSQISNRYRPRFSCRSNVLKMAAIIGITFVFWYIHFRSIFKKGENIISALLGESEAETILTYNVDMVVHSGAPLIRIVEGFIKVYGPVVICFVAASFICLYLVKEFLNNRKHADEIIYVVFFLLSLTFGAALTFGHFIVFEFIRAVSFAIIMSTITCGIGFYVLIKDADTSKRKQILSIIVITVLCSVSFLSIFNLYPSPWITSSSQQMTKMETSGLDWFLMNQDESTPLYFKDYTWYKYALYFQELQKVTVQQPLVITKGIPHHFGYDQREHLVQSINNSGDDTFYLATNERLKQSVLAVLEEWRSFKDYFSKDDFSRLNSDNTVMKIYENSEWEIWRTN